MFVLYANVCRLFVFDRILFCSFFVFVFVGANEMHGQFDWCLLMCLYMFYMPIESK